MEDHTPGSDAAVGYGQPFAAPYYRTTAAKTRLFHSRLHQRAPAGEFSTRKGSCDSGPVSNYHHKTLLARKARSRAVGAFDHFIEWLENHEDWGTLAFCSIFILPTWLLFRKAPAYPKHTLPEGFFIQVFQCIQIVIVSFVVDDLLLLISLPFLLIYNYINYKQLFGYGVWGTIWRQVLMLIISFALFFLIFYLIAITMRLIDMM